MVTLETGESLSGLTSWLGRNDRRMNKLALIASARHGFRLHRQTLDLPKDLESLKVAASRNTEVQALKVSVTGQRYHSYLCAVEACLALGQLKHLSLVLYGPTAVHDVFYLLARFVPHITSLEFRRLSIEFRHPANREDAASTNKSNKKKPSPVHELTSPQQQQQPQPLQAILQQRQQPKVSARPLIYTEVDFRRVLQPLMDKIPQLQEFVLKGHYDSDVRDESHYYSDSFAIRFLQVLSSVVEKRNEEMIQSPPQPFPEPWQHSNGGEASKVQPTLLRTVFTDLKTNQSTTRVHWQKENVLTLEGPNTSETWYGFRHIVEHVQPFHVKFAASLSSAQQQLQQQQPQHTLLRSSLSALAPSNHNNNNVPTPPETPDSSSMDLADDDLDDDEVSASELAQAVETWCDDVPNVLVNLSTVVFRGHFSPFMTSILSALVSLQSLQSMSVESFSKPLRRSGAGSRGRASSNSDTSAESRAHSEQFLLEKFPNEKITLKCNAFRSSYWVLLQNLILENQPTDMHLAIKPFTSPSAPLTPQASPLQTRPPPTVVNKNNNNRPQLHNTPESQRPQPILPLGPQLPTRLQGTRIPLAPPADPFQVLALPEIGIVPHKQQRNDDRSSSPVPDDVAEDIYLSMPLAGPVENIDARNNSSSNNNMERALTFLTGRMSCLNFLRANIDPHTILTKVLQPFKSCTGLVQVELNGTPITVFAHHKSNNEKKKKQQKQPPQNEENTQSADSNASGTSWKSKCGLLPLSALELLLSFERLQKLVLKQYRFVDDESDRGGGGTLVNGSNRFMPQTVPVDDDDDRNTTDRKERRIASLWSKDFVDSGITEFCLDHCVLTKMHAQGLAKAARAKKNLKTLALLVETPPLSSEAEDQGGGLLVNGTHRPHSSNYVAVNPLPATTTLWKSMLGDEDLVENMVANLKAKNLRCHHATPAVLQGLRSNKSIQTFTARIEPPSKDLRTLEEEKSSFWHSLKEVIRDNDCLHTLDLHGISNVAPQINQDIMLELANVVQHNYALQEIFFKDVPRNLTGPDRSAMNHSWTRVCAMLKLNKAGRGRLKAVQNRKKKEEDDKDAPSTKDNNVPLLSSSQIRALGVTILAAVAHELTHTYFALLDNPSICDLDSKFVPNDKSEEEKKEECETVDVLGNTKPTINSVNVQGCLEAEDNNESDDRRLSGHKRNHGLVSA